MSIEQMLSAMNVSASGMSAERLRMEVVANNLANAHSTRGPDGQPFRRRQVIFESLVNSAGGSHGELLGAGVKVVAVEEDSTPLPRVHDPSHRHADADGYVTMTNVKPAFEMVDMITASRSYEANLRAMRTYREMAEQSLELLRRG